MSLLDSLLLAAAVWLALATGLLALAGRRPAGLRWRAAGAFAAAATSVGLSSVAGAAPAAVLVAVLGMGSSPYYYHDGGGRRERCSSAAWSAPRASMRST